MRIVLSTRHCTGVLVLAFAVVACGSGGNGGPGGPGAGGSWQAAPVVATTSILGEITTAIARPCGLATDTLMGSNVDAHSFAPSARQIARMRDAVLLVVNGGDYEEGLIDGIRAARAGGVRTFEALRHASPLPAGSGLDPHFWHDPRRTAAVARALGAALGVAQPAQAGCLRARAREEAAALERLDRRVERTLAAIPASHRRLALVHDAFAYLAERYDFEVVGALTSPLSESEPSAAAIARLARTVREDRLPAVVGVVGELESLAATLARESGSGVRVIPLLAESRRDQPSYAAMLELNARRLAAGLR
jgi:zinc/manganese transport system substrate-binding protein